MDVVKRIRLIRLAEKIDKNLDFSRKIGTQAELADREKGRRKK